MDARDVCQLPSLDESKCVVVREIIFAGSLVPVVSVTISSLVDARDVFMLPSVDVTKSAVVREIISVDEDPNFMVSPNVVVACELDCCGVWLFLTSDKPVGVSSSMVDAVDIACVVTYGSLLSSTVVAVVSVMAPVVGRGLGVGGHLASRSQSAWCGGTQTWRSTWKSNPGMQGISNSSPPIHWW